MANFQQNSWYQVTLKSSNILSFASSAVGNGAGSAFYQVTNTTRLSQQWQFFATENNTYVIRSNLGGAHGYLTARTSAKSPINSGNTVPGLLDYKLADDSMYWTISPWGDGSFWMENQANGTAWHLERELNGLGAMSSNITAPQVGQSFIFKELGAINDKAYSSVQTATTTPTSRPSLATTTLGAGTATGTADSSASSGLSTGAKAGIGAGVGAAALLALILGVVLLLHRRKRNGAKAYVKEESAAYHSVEQTSSMGDPMAYASPASKTEKRDQRAELPSESSQPTAELEAPRKTETASPVELDSSAVGYKPYRAPPANDNQYP